MIDIERRSDAPPSLSNQTSYSGEDVQRALREDFLGKCYLCEGILRGDIEVEHRKGRSAGEFDWWNLFPAHHDCNNRRPRIHPSGGYLEPGRHHDLESRLIQQFRPNAQVEVHFAASDRVRSLKAGRPAHGIYHGVRGGHGANQGGES